MKSNPSSRGFTLIELLVVIAIISIMTGIVVTSLAASKSKTRDAQRISDLSQVQLALELAFDRCKEYPQGTGTWLITVSAGGALCTPSGVAVYLRDFISVLPVSPPPPGSYNYYVSTAKDSYVLRVALENDNEVLGDDLDGLVSGFIGGKVYTGDPGCDDGVSKFYCLGPK